MNRSRLWSSLLITLVALACLAPDSVQAQRKPGGGGGTSTPARFSVVEFSALTWPRQMSNVDENGWVTIVGEGVEGAYQSAAVAKVHLATKTVTSFLLPEPTDGLSLDADSHANDVNRTGTIVGASSIFEGPIDNNNRISKPCRWVPQGTGYRHEQLPLLAGNRYGGVREINDWGWMIGMCGTETTGDPAVWPPNGQEVLALESALPPDSGWEHLGVNSINNWNQIVGTGLYGGVKAGFVMNLEIGIDPDTGAWVLSSTIARLIPPTGTDWFNPSQISDTGEIVGTAIFADGSAVATLQADAMSPAQALSVGSDDTDAYQRNSAGQIVGTTNTPEKLIATLWEPQTGGGFTSTALDSLVPTKPAWQITNSFGINEQGCICAKSSKFDKGKYTFPGVLLVPNP